MKVYLIKASAPGPFKEYKKAMGSPPQNIFSVAAATPPEVDVELCDETIDMKPNYRVKAKIVGIFFHTPDAVHAYKMADKYKSKGYTVVIGGLHASFMPDEAAAHCDTLLVGEAEGVWEELLSDYQMGVLKKRYQRDAPVDLATVRAYPTTLISPRKYQDVWSVLVSRGCVHRCEFCVIPPFFGKQYRLRPIEKIVAEIKAAPTNWFELHSDNLTANRDYALELFKALIPLNINWVGEATIKLADDEELLRAAADSGCKELLIGIETSSKDALTNTGKSFVDPASIREKIDVFHRNGIAITSSMIFGFDSHGPDIFKESLEFCSQIGIDSVEAVILIPFPGTPLYRKMEEEGRILSHDWAKYDGSHAVFQPKGMSPAQLEEGAAWFWTQVQKKSKIPTITATGGSSLTRYDDLERRRKKSTARGSKANEGSVTYSGKWEESAPILHPPKRWRSILALCLIATGLFFDWYWVWGILFIFWALLDLRNRRTYLLEDIPRSECPVLYWVIVLLWLTLAGWSVSFFNWEQVKDDVLYLVSDDYYKDHNSALPLVVAAQDVIGNVTGSKQTLGSEPDGATFEAVVQSVKPANSTRLVVTKPTGASEGAMASSPSTEQFRAKPKTSSVREPQIIENSKANFRVTLPKRWKYKTESSSEMVTVSMEAPNRLANVTLVAVDCGFSLSDEQFAEYMDKDLVKEYPMMNTDNLRSVERGTSGGLVKKYRGKYAENEVDLLVLYRTSGKHGYALIGLYDRNDKKTARDVEALFSSFSITGIS